MSSYVVDRLLSGGSEVTVIDNFRARRLEKVAHRQGRKDFRVYMGGGEF